MSTVSADGVPDTAPASYGLSTREECTALAQAITIRARVKLAQAYASLYEGWVAEDQLRRDAANATPAMDGVSSPPGPPDPAMSPSGAQGGPRARRKFWSDLLRGKRS